MTKTVVNILEEWAFKVDFDKLTFFFFANFTFAFLMFFVLFTHSKILADIRTLKYFVKVCLLLNNFLPLFRMSANSCGVHCTTFPSYKTVPS